MPYLAQQWPPKQHVPPPQQSATGEVAVAVPIMARAAIVIKRYFIESLLLNFLRSRPYLSEPMRVGQSAARRRHWRTIRP